MKFMFYPQEKRSALCLPASRHCTSRRGTSNTAQRTAALALGLMVPALLAAPSQSHAFSYDPDVPGANANVVAVSETSYGLTDSSPVTGTVVPVNSGMNSAQIQSAINGAPLDSTVVFANGTYNVGDITVTRKVTLRPAQDGKVWFDGAVLVTNWTRVSNVSTSADFNKWFTDSDPGAAGRTPADFSYEFPGNTDRPYIAQNPGQNSRYIADSINLFSDEGEMVFRDGRPQVQVGSLANVAAGKFFIDRGADKLYIFSGTAPTGVAITRYDFALDVDAAGATLSGLNFRRYAGSAPTGGSPNGAVRISNGNLNSRTKVDNCSFFWNGHYGLYTRAGGTIVTRSKFVSNGSSGIAFATGTVSGNTIAWNNAEGFSSGWDAAGIKITGSPDTVVYDNFLEGNKGNSAIWVDIFSTVQVFRNYIKGGNRYAAGGESNEPNPTAGVFFELSKGCTAAFNLFDGNGSALHIAASPNSRVYNNTFYNNNEHLRINDETGRTEGTIELRLNGTQILNNILINGGTPAINAVIGGPFDGKGGQSTASKNRFATLNFNVYRTGNSVFNWLLPNRSVKNYPNLTAFRDPLEANNTGAFEASGLERTADQAFLDAGSKDFRVPSTDAALTSGGAALTSGGAALPADIRALMRDSSEFPFIDAALKNSGLAALGSFGAAPNSAAQRFRGAFKPANAAPAATLTAPANSSRTIVSAGTSTNLTLIADAQDDGAIDRVDFFNGSTLLGTDSDPADGWSLTFNAPRGNYLLTARAVDNEGANGTSPTVSHTVLERVRAINAGDTLAAGSFVADAGFSGGIAYKASPAPGIDVSAVTNPAPLGVYQSERYGPSDFSYSIGGLMPNQPYTVRLHFAETYAGVTKPGDRLFNISVTGAAALNNFDIFAAAGGAGKAVVREFTATSNTAGAIAISFGKLSGADSPKINGLEILR